jgi:hypothetical protein
MGRSLLFGGVIVALLGLLGIAVPMFTTEHTRDVARIGELKIQTTETRAYAIPTLVSGGAVVLGVVLIGAGLYRRT